MQFVSLPASHWCRLLTSVFRSSDHFYPTYTSRLSSSASLAHSHGKPFLAGEYDWTDLLYSKLRFAWFATAVPGAVSSGDLVLAGKEAKADDFEGCLDLRRVRKEEEAEAEECRGG